MRSSYSAIYQPSDCCTGLNPANLLPAHRDDEVDFDPPFLRGAVRRGALARSKELLPTRLPPPL
jgi:hypothetical protein